MSVAALMNIPTTDDEFNQWAFAHAAHHRDCIRATLQQKGIELAEYVLDPMNRGDGFGTWLLQPPSHAHGSERGAECGGV